MKKRIALLTLALSAQMYVDSFAQQRMPLVYEVENTGANVPKPALPAISNLPNITHLPDPFQWADTSRGRITQRSDWRYRRAEISAQLQHYQLGNKPSPPNSDSLQAVLSNDTLIVTVQVGANSLTLRAVINLPDSGTGPFPAVIGMGGGTGSLPSDIFTSRQIATIAYNFSELAPWGSSRGQGGFYTLFPDAKVGNYTAWSWGISRIIDGLAKVPQANIDLRHLAVTGCSFAGKMALYAGALDERIALTIAQEPGGGGDATWRFSETIGSSVEILRNAQGNAWYYQDVSQFNYEVTKLPIDQHEVMAMIAPRALLVLGNPDYVWLADESGYVGCVAASEVWRSLGASDRFGFSKVGGHSHCALPNVQRPEVTGFVQKFLLRDSAANTNVWITPWSTDVTPWMKWSTPKLSTTSVSNSEKVIDEFGLLQNYPNPFNPTTKISFVLSRRDLVTLSIHNVLGEHVATLVDSELGAGLHSVFWDGAQFASGAYFYTLRTKEFNTTKCMLLLK